MSAPTIRVPVAELRRAYEALQAAERIAAAAPFGSPAAQLWHELMWARVGFRVYVIDELKNTEAPVAALQV